MRRITLLGLFLLLGLPFLGTSARGHGGTYTGPGDTVPAGGGGGGGGGGVPTGPSGGGSGGGTGGSTGVPAPGTPGSTGGPAVRGAGNSTGGPGSGTDLADWQFWWNFNKDRYLGLRAAIHSGLSTGEPFGDGFAAERALEPSQADIRGKVVPALLAALEKERANDIVTGALIALAKIGDARGEDGSSSFEEILKRWLPEPSQEIAETAAVALGIMANESSVPALAALMTDGAAGRGLVGKTEVPYRTRAFAAYGLGLIGARTNSNGVRQQIVDALVGELERRESSTRDLQVAALVALGLTPLDVAAGADLDPKSGASSSRQAQIAYLQRFLADDARHALLRAHAPTAMARLLAREKALPPALGAARDEVVGRLVAKLSEQPREKKEEVRQSCVLALGMLADLDSDGCDAAAREALARLSKEGTPQERCFALIALGQLASRPGSGAESARNLGVVRAQLVERLDKGNAGQRPWAALALGVLERGLDDLGSSALPASFDAKHALRAALKACGNPEMAGAYAVALGLARDGESVGLLRAKLRDWGADGPKGYMALGLGMIGAIEARAEIQAIVKDSKYRPELLQQAAIALGLLGDKTLVPDLVEMLRDSKGLAGQAAVASALGFIGDARSIDPLVAMLRNPALTATARGFAAASLGIVADKEPLRWTCKISSDLNYRANTSTLTTPEATGILDLL